MTGLCPGFKYVETFGEDGEYEEETEVSYVTLDLGTNVDKTLLPNTSEYRLVGLDTATPMLQLSGLFFKGTHEELIGTEILFTDGRDDTDLSRKFVVPVGTTEKRIQFQQVEVTSKEPKAAAETKESPKMPRTKGRGKSSGKTKGRDNGKATSLLHEYGETTLDLDDDAGSSVHFTSHSSLH